jgi:hypothetical protein
MAKAAIASCAASNTLNTFIAATQVTS